VIDDYYTQCKVFQDCNGNGAVDANEPSCTIVEGRCTLASYTFNLTHCNTHLLIQGQEADCVDAGTSAKPFIDLAGSGTTISILTTMHAQLMALDQLTNDEAFKKLTDAFPKLVGVDIHNDDPVAGQLYTRGTVLRLHINHIGMLSMVNSVMAQMISTMNTAQSRRLNSQLNPIYTMNGASTRQLAEFDPMAAATESFAKSIASADASKPLDLTDTASIVTMISTAFEVAKVDASAIPDANTLKAIAESTASINSLTQVAVESADTSGTSGSINVMSSINTFNYMAQISLKAESEQLVSGTITVDSFKEKTDATTMQKIAETAVQEVKANRPTSSPTKAPTKVPTTLAPTKVPTKAPTAVYGTVEFDLQIAGETDFTVAKQAILREAVATTMGVQQEFVTLTVGVSQARRLAGATVVRVLIKAVEKNSFLSISAKLSDLPAYVGTLAAELNKLGLPISADSLAIENVVVADPSPDSSGGSSPVIPIVVVVIILLIGAALYVLKRKQQAKGSSYVMKNSQKIYNDDSVEDAVPLPAAAPAEETLSVEEAGREATPAADADDFFDDEAESAVLGPPSGLMMSEEEKEEDEDSLDDSDEYDDSDDDDELAAANILGPPAWIAESWQIQEQDTAE